jgi:hypothetical protein
MSNWGAAALCIVVIGACGVGIGACGGSSAPPPAPPQQQPQVVQGDFYMEMEPAAQTGEATGCCADKPAHRDQPPEVKLALGHYSNSRRGIGAIIDVTQKVAKVRYDGTDNIIELYGSPGAYGRTDYYKNASLVLLQVWDDGRIVVFIPNAPTARDGIALSRDADADPL